MVIALQLFSIFVLGLIGGATPGPILTSIFTDILRKGFINSLEIIFQALASEIIVASTILILFFYLNIPQSVFHIISFVGAGILIWLATLVWKIKKLDDKGKIFSFKKIFLLTVFNGQLWIFWISICVPLAYNLSQKIIGGQFIFLLFFELGWLVATTAMAYVFSYFRKLITKGEFVQILFKIFALILIFFAIKLIVENIAFIIKF
jgi:threonine/homoserine/homoserine lactone efflux protein